LPGPLAEMRCQNVGTALCDHCDMKICPRCKEKKALDEFYRKKGRSAGSYRKPCQHAYVREHYRKTRVSIAAKATSSS
jgi:hypothetical protein